MAAYDNVAMPAAPAAPSYAAPLLNFAPIGNLANDYYNGVQQRRTMALQSAFQNGLPRNQDGSLNIGSMTDTLAKLGGAEAAAPLMQLQIEQQVGNAGASAIGGQPQAGGVTAPASGGGVNNPGNIENGSFASSQPGFVPSGARFANFANPQQGAAAVDNLLKVYGARGVNTPNAIASRWAPAGDGSNNPTAYGAFIANKLGIGPNDPINMNDPNVRQTVGQAISQFEGNKKMVPGQAGQPGQSGQPTQVAGPSMVQNGQPGQPLGQPGQPQQPAQGQPTQQPQGQAGQPNQMPAGMDEATAQQYEQNAQRAYQQATRLGALPNGQNMSANLRAYADAQMEQAKVIRQAIAKNAEAPPAVKEFQAGAEPGETLPQYQARAAGMADDAKQDVTTFTKRNTGLQALGEQSYNGIQKAQLMKNLTLQPTFYSGPFHEGVETYNQFKSVFGSNPTSALPQEAFNKVTNDMLTEQVKAMGQSGVGRVLQTEVNTMKQAIASLGITPASNRALAEIVSRVYQQQHDIAGIGRSIPHQPGKMNTALDTQINGYLKAHPLFTPQEIQDPRLLAAPDAPPQSANWSSQQKQAWASSVGLKSGDIIRFNGQPVTVP